MAQLLKAAANGNLEKVIDLRDQWNFQNKKGETVLHIAVSEDQLEIVSYLVSHGAPLDYQDKKNRFTPLMLCLAQRPPRYLEIVQALLKGKPDLTIQDSAGQTVLHLATQYEEVEVVEMLLRSKPKVDAVDAKKMTPLHVAAGKGNVELVKILIERGHASPNAVDAKGNTPLHWVCILNAEDLTELIAYLVAKGSRPVKNYAGNTPLHAEAMHCDTSAKWPTEAAEALMKAFPQLETETNEKGLTAQQVFDQGIDSEEPTAPAPESNASQESKGPHKRKGGDRMSPEDFQENAAAARAAAIARTKKKAASKHGQENASLLVKLLYIILALAVLAGAYSLIFA
ncbi:hypothetical protein Poli38472_000746 [Pythium oligandrum]|uniref:Uncharacterized protein n=1 Tax=Pythium oligandrum TaxID=41045 RepID=A0A8K1FH63_PYTOL|nr:hypothetical protein Poli38472_000746 [Pythium oligandrum]|eukprot:TMW60704.1 hypothetical protein Poli38472_000746 [Pythium oligandrum]